MLLGHCLLIFQFFDDDHPEVIEGMTSFLEMFVNFDGVRFLCIVPMFIDASVRLLGLDLADILPSIVTFVAPCLVYGVLAPATGLLSHVESFSPRSVCEHPRIHDVGAASGVRPSTAWGAPA